MLEMEDWWVSLGKENGLLEGGKLVFDVKKKVSSLVRALLDGLISDNGGIEEEERHRAL